MKCPACSRELTEIHAGTVAVNVCQGGCGGLWFDAFDPQQVWEQNQAAGEVLLCVKRDRDLTVDPARLKFCPRCGDVQLKRLVFGPGSRANIDECPKCGGGWFDDGELAQVHFEQSQSREAGSAKATGETDDLIRYLYEVRTGRRRK